MIQWISMRLIIYSFLCVSLGFLFLFSLSHKIYAASSTLGFTPQSGTYNSQFTVSLVIDGHGDKFNAAGATVTPSSDLAIKDLVVGDCNFSFLKTPSIQDPSFEGVILSSSTTKCTVYTLKLVPIAKGSSSLILSKTTVRRYGDAANILASTTNGSYTLTQALSNPITLNSQIGSRSKNGLYNLSLKILSSQNQPATNMLVSLSEVGSKTKHTGTTDTSGLVHFPNLQSGLYDGIIDENGTKVGETIINVNGQNHTIMLSINLKDQTNNPLLKGKGFVLGATTSPFTMAGLLVLGIVLGTIFAVVFTRFQKSKH